MSRPCILLLSLLALTGCGEKGVAGDAAVDEAADLPGDAADDPGLDADAVADVDLDGSGDPDADVVEETAGDPDGDEPADVDVDQADALDARGDEDPDAPGDPDGEPPPECVSGDTIADVRDLSVPAHGDSVDVDLTLCDVLVTYVHDGGFFVQVDPDGPAVGAIVTSAHPLRVGDRVDLHVARVENFHGNTRVMDPTVLWVEHGFTSQALALARDLDTGILPGPELSDEIVRVTGAAVSDITGGNLATLEYGTAVDALLLADDPGPLCVGATLDVLAVVEQSDGTFGIHSYNAGDLSGIDTWWCGLPPVPGEIVLNEFLADPPDVNGDANCDGIREGLQDEFVELVNVSSNRISLAGVSIFDSVATRRMRHLFEDWRMLEPGEAIVVFGGGSPGSDMSSALGCIPWPDGTQVTWANQSYFSLGLNNTGDTIEVWYDESGAFPSMLLSHTYGTEGESDQSWTLSPDLTGTFTLHTEADTADASPWSPGTRLDGAPF